MVSARARWLHRCVCSLPRADARWRVQWMRRRALRPAHDVSRDALLASRDARRLPARFSRGVWARAVCGGARAQLSAADAAARYSVNIASRPGRDRALQAGRAPALYCALTWSAWARRIREGAVQKVPGEGVLSIATSIPPHCALTSVAAIVCRMAAVQRRMPAAPTKRTIQDFWAFSGLDAERKTSRTAELFCP